MARCKRCGAIFDYDKKDGVCPRCCFYNRPPGAPHHDDEWLSTYNIEDNTFQLPKQSAQIDEEPKSIWHKKRPNYKKKVSSKKNCDTEGSHVHTPSRPKTREDYEKREEPPERKGPRRLLLALLIILAVVFVVMFIGRRLRNISVHKEKTPTPPREFNIEKKTMEDLINGIQVGDMNFSTMGQGAMVLFSERDLPEIPAGEMCIGIHLQDDESSLGYNGIYWERPYVYDGTNYRELVDGTLMNAKGIDRQMGIDFMKQFVSSVNDFDGLAIYFVDDEAQSVTLCIPNQTLGDDDKVQCSGVVEIEMPIIPRQQEGGENGE